MLLLELEDVYASSDVNIVMMMFFELFLLRKISEFPSGTLTNSGTEGCGFESRLGTQIFSRVNSSKNIIITIFTSELAYIF